MKKHNIAILGFGVVGGGVAELITKNRDEIKEYLSTEVAIKRILDLRDFPDSPFAPLVTHDFSEIVNDAEIDTVMELMGGSHPAYEYTVAALRAGKNVITSNKEVVAKYGDEFVRIADETGVSYRFEAAVGGGIPVINPLLGCIRQNKIEEVRGILNGTTNYILTKMFTYGESFESALRDAQAKGYAEANPAADVEGTDAARKITILTALACGRLYDVSTVHTEGITAIRAEDVAAAEAINHKIKLLGRCIRKDGEEFVMVAPFLLPCDSPLSTVNGVYNAVEVIGEPIGNIMLYGQGAGAGATASAAVGDLLPIIAYGSKNPIVPSLNRTSKSAAESFSSFTSRKYISVSGVSREKIAEVFGNVCFLETNELAFITDAVSERATEEGLSRLGASVLSLIRFL